MIVKLMKYRVSLFIKKIRISGKFFWRRLKKIIIWVLGKGFLAISMIFFACAIFSNISHKIPVLEYFVRELQLPVVYNISGKIEVCGKEDVHISDIEIAIGGYKKIVGNNENFDMNFCAANDKDIPVVVSYVYNNKRCERVEYISFDKYQEEKIINWIYRE